MEHASPQPSSLLDWLIARYPGAKRQTLKRMVENGRVTINGQPARKLKQPVTAGDAVRVAARGGARAAVGGGEAEAATLPFQIVYEDADVVVVNKPPGLLTSTVVRETRPTLWAMLKAHVTEREPKARVGLIHRLDRDAQGLLVFSKNNAAYESLKTQFFRHTVRRVYMAIVQGVPVPREGKIESHLVERADGSVHSTREPGKGQHAVTEYAVLRDDGQRALVRVTLHTGRKHQIRAHLAERGTPIVGDAVYGQEQADAGGRLLLAAVELAFEHPKTGKRVELVLPLPKEMRSVLKGA